MAPFSHFQIIAYSLAVIAVCHVVGLGLHLWSRWRSRR
jgi:hypothetical protein